MEKILNEIDNIGQLSANMRFKINNGNYDLETELSSIEKWVEILRRRLKKESKSEKSL